MLWILRSRRPSSWFPEVGRWAGKAFKGGTFELDLKRDGQGLSCRESLVAGKALQLEERVGDEQCQG